jgi:hypothetical protein
MSDQKQQTLKILRIISWLITAVSILFFIVNVIDFATSKYYNFEMDEDVNPTASMIFVYSLGALAGSIVIPILFWGIYALIHFFPSAKLQKIMENQRMKSTERKIARHSRESRDQAKTVISKIMEIPQAMDQRKKSLVGIIWILFHLFLLLTSKDILYYRLTWEDFWFFNNWTDYDSSFFGSHYDITEFMIYVITPLIIILGRRYLRGQEVFPWGTSYPKDAVSVDQQATDLKKIKELYDLGILTETEFIEMKNKLLNK